MDYLSNSRKLELELDASLFRKHCDTILPSPSSYHAPGWFDAVRAFDLVVPTMVAPVGDRVIPVEQIVCEGDTDPIAAMTVFDCSRAFVIFTEGTYAELRADREWAKLALNHEVCHVRQHASLTGRSFFRYGGRNGDEAREWRRRVEEREAHYFARCVLVPWTGLAQLDTADCLTGETVKRQFGVSRELAKRRVLEYGVLTSAGGGP